MSCLDRGDRGPLPRQPPGGGRSRRRWSRRGGAGHRGAARITVILWPGINRGLGGLGPAAQRASTLDRGKEGEGEVWRRGASRDTKGIEGRIN